MALLKAKQLDYHNVAYSPRTLDAVVNTNEIIRIRQLRDDEHRLSGKAVIIYFNDGSVGQYEGVVDDFIATD